MEEGKRKLAPPTQTSHLRPQIDVDMIGALDQALRHNSNSTDSVNAAPIDANPGHYGGATAGIPLWAASHAANPAVMAMITGSGDPGEDPIGRIPAALLETNRPPSSVPDTRENRRPPASAPSHTPSVRPGQSEDPCPVTQHSRDDIRRSGLAVNQTTQYPPTEDLATGSPSILGLESEHVCTVCNLAFLNSDALASHALKEKHRTYKCPVTSCGTAFLYRDSLASHMQRGAHNEGGRAGPRGRECECTICETKFPSVNKLQEHARATDHATLHCVNKGCHAAYARSASYYYHLSTCAFGK
jgi:hypothetical protein